MLNLEIRAGTNEKQVRIIYLQYTYVPKCTFRCDLNCCIHNVFNYIQWVIFRSNHAIDKLMGWNWSVFFAIPIPTRPNFDCEAKILMNHICSNGLINSDVMAQKVWCEHWWCNLHIFLKKRSDTNLKLQDATDIPYICLPLGTCTWWLL